MIKYTRRDMVKISCNDCRGCSNCCRGMGDSIKLNPYDIYKLCSNLNCDPVQLLKEQIELQVDEGIIVPNIKMQQDTNACGFLNEEGRCRIHSFRPSLCRLFPLGRDYDGERFSYFVLEDACPAKGKSKVKIEKWIGEPSMNQYEAFITDWHYLLKACKQKIIDMEEAEIKQYNMKFLQCFFLQPYDEEVAFYEQYQNRKRYFIEE